METSSCFDKQKHLQQQDFTKSLVNPLYSKSFPFLIRHKSAKSIKMKLVHVICTDIYKFMCYKKSSTEFKDPLLMLLLLCV